MPCYLYRLHLLCVSMDYNYGDKNDTVRFTYGKITYVKIRICVYRCGTDLKG